MVRDPSDLLGVLPVRDDVVQNTVAALAAAADNMHNSVIATVEAVCDDRRRRASRGALPHFAVGDFVFVARVQKRGHVSKLMSTWTGPWRVIDTSKPHIYQVLNSIDGSVTTSHAARLKFYHDTSLGVTAEVKEAFQHLYNQGVFQLDRICEIHRVSGGASEVYVAWLGFDESERFWEPVQSIFADVPSFVVKELSSLLRPISTRRGLLHWHGKRIASGAGESLPP